MSRILRIYTLTLAHIAVAVLQDLYLWKKNNDGFFCLFVYFFILTKSLLHAAAGVFRCCSVPLTAAY